MKQMKLMSELCCAAVATMLASCADLGFGIDVDPSGATPYMYGSGYLGNTYYNAPPLWTGSPWFDYGPVAPAPPVVRPRPLPAPPQQALPNFRPTVNTSGGINGIPTTVLPSTRPGNMGQSPRRESQH